MNTVLEHNKLINEFTVDNRVASMMNNLSTDYIFHVIKDSLGMKFRPYSTAMPNMVYSYEQFFIYAASSDEPVRAEDINQKKDDTYMAIIDLLCKAYDLDYHTSGNLYTDAFYLYSFLLSDFTNTLITFFLNYITQEKNNIYSNLNLEEGKKSKDSSAAYSKRIYNGQDDVIAIIHANIVSIVRDICTYDISLQDIITSRYYGTEAGIAQHLMNIISDKGNFYKNHIVPFAQGQYQADTINCIKLSLQRNAEQNIF